MNHQSPGIERFTFSAVVRRRYRWIYTHKLQWYCWILGMAIVVHLIPNFGKLLWHYHSGHTPSLHPDLFAFCLSVAARVAWTYLFRDPAGFLGFRRPARAYRWVVCGTVAMTTLPNFMVHVWALKMALKEDGFFYHGVIRATWAIVILVPLMGFVWWMAWTFLLGVHESNEEFEPTAESGLVGSRERNRVPGTIILDRTDVFITLPLNVDTSDYLSQLYKEQKLAEQELRGNQNLTEPSGDLQSGEAPHREVESVEPSLGGTPDSGPILENATPPRCRTTARLEYMSQAYSGPHSWLSFPMVPLVLSMYATILLVGLPIFIHEDREYKLRPPSPTIKNSLYFPLGLYLLSFYTLKHRARVSLFEKFDIPLPEPWRKIIKYRPWRKRTSPRFCNLDTGEFIVHDPRRRGFPPGAEKRPEGIRTRSYFEAYNASPGACATYWGHSGHAVKGGMRFRPTIYRVGFILLAAYFVGKGYYNILSYKPPNVYAEIIKHRKTITVDDIKRIIRLMQLWQAFLTSSFWLIIFFFIFVLAVTGSMLVLFFRAVWKYIPQETKDRISTRAWEQEQVSRMERIRLE